MAKTTTTTQTTKRNPEATHSIQHIELVSTEPAKFRKFLEKQFGWTFETHKTPNGEYHAFRTPDGNGGGITPPMNPGHTGATPYINVENIEATLKSCQKNGATIMMPITDVPGMGKFFWFQVAGGPPLACWQATGTTN